MTTDPRVRTSLTDDALRADALPGAGAARGLPRVPGRAITLAAARRRS